MDQIATSFEQFEKIKNQINEANNITVIISENASVEAVVSGLALCEALEAKSKNVSVYGSSSEVERISFLEKASIINKSIAPENLIVSLGYDKEQIEKVGYESKNGQFNLIITPKKGRIDPSQATFVSEGINTDLIIVLGAKKLEELGVSYLDHKEEFENKEILNIDNQEKNEYFAGVNVVNSAKSTLTEVLIPVLDVLEIDWKNKVANLLLIGLYLGTNNFHSRKINSETFLAVSKLLERGADLEYVITTLEVKENGSKKGLSSDVAGTSTHALSPETPPTPFLKGQEDQIQMEEPPVFQKNIGEF